MIAVRSVNQEFFYIYSYESTWDRVQPSVYCVNCHNPMSLACTKCDSAMLQSSSLQVSPDGSSSTFVTPPSVDPIVIKRGSSKTTKKSNSKKGKLAATSESNLQENDEDLAGLCIKFEQPSSYADHIVFPCPDAKRSEIKSYLCTRCGKTFFKSSDLKKHVRIHTHEKPYKCDRCPSAFSDPSSYSRHKRVHTGEKPFVCQECNTGFAQSSDLTKHIRIHTRERPLQCQFCSDCFSDPSSFARHRRKHLPT